MELTEEERYVLVGTLNEFKERAVLAKKKLAHDTECLLFNINKAEEIGVSLKDEDLEEASTQASISFRYINNDIKMLDLALAILGEN